MKTSIRNNSFVKNYRPIVIAILFFVFLFHPYGHTEQDESVTVTIQKVSTKKDSFLIDLSVSRLNKLFGILLNKEQTYKNELDRLNVLSFHDLISSNMTYPSESKTPNAGINEIRKYFEINGDQLMVTQKFVNHLKNKSDFYSYTHPRLEPRKQNGSNVGQL